MSIFSSIKSLQDSARTLSTVALDSSEDVGSATNAVRISARQVGDAADAVKTLAQLVGGVVMALAIGWTVGTLVRVTLELLTDDDEA